MNDGNYVVVFDLLQSGYRQWWLPGFGLVFIPMIIVIISLVEGQRRIKTGRPSKWEFMKNMRLLTIAMVAFSLLWALATFVGTFADYWNCSHALASGKASYVEGTVDDFIPMPYQGHANETFTVNGVPFSYSDFEVEAGFNNSSSHGGPIREGLPVRIWYVGKEIVKLEIKKTNP